MSRQSLRSRLVAAGVVAGLGLGGFAALPAGAAGKDHPSGEARRAAAKERAEEHRSAAKERAEEHRSAAKEQRAAAKARFVIVGKVTAVDAAGRTLTVKVKGSNRRALRRSEQTVHVAADARIRRDGAAATLADIELGDRVLVKGTREESGDLTAKKVNAHSPEADAEPAPAS